MIINIYKCLVLLIILPNLVFAASFVERGDVQEFIKKMHEKHNFNEQQLKTLFSKISSNSKVLARISRPAEKLAWFKYEKLFINSRVIKRGIKFWEANKKILTEVSEKYGVPAEIIVAILAAESKCGTSSYPHYTMETLATLAFDYPPRQEFFKNELREFLLLSKEQNWQPLNLKGSYASALGMPQFIPSSYRSYAVDYANKGSKDLFQNIPDIVASVANFLKKHGWKPGEQIAVPVALQNASTIELIRKTKSSPKLHYSLAALTELGVIFPKKLSTTQNKFSIMEFRKKVGADYWVGLQNFYTITRYNRSNLYAMVVYQLSCEINKGMGHNIT